MKTGGRPRVPATLDERAARRFQTLIFPLRVPRPVPSGYSGTPLERKLGLKPGMRVFLEGAPEAVLRTLAPALKATMKKDTLRPPLDFVHLFVRDRRRLTTRFNRAVRAIGKDGMVWVSWPKKSANIETDLDSGFVRQHGLACGLVDVKVCAVDETWSGLKFVYRVKDR